MNRAEEAVSVINAGLKYRRKRHRLGHTSVLVRERAQVKKKRKRGKLEKRKELDGDNGPKPREENVWGFVMVT